MPRAHRDRRTVGVVRSSSTIAPIDRVELKEFGCTSATRAIVDMAGRVTMLELENAVDSALRLGWTSEPFLRKRLTALRHPGRRGVRALDRALDGAGGHSQLERRFLALVKSAGLPRPECQTIYRAGGHFVARTDFTFSSRCIVEVAGHATHASRQQRARDAQRQAELQLLGFVVLWFTYEQVVNEPEWVIQTLRRALLPSLESAERSPTGT